MRAVLQAAPNDHHHRIDAPAPTTPGQRVEQPRRADGVDVVGSDQIALGVWREADACEMDNYVRPAHIDSPMDVGVDANVHCLPANGVPFGGRQNCRLTGPCAETGQHEIIAPLEQGAREPLPDEAAAAREQDAHAQTLAACRARSASTISLTRSGNVTRASQPRAARSFP